jgi:peptidoglycan/xylan/chitin deacetylase (PgdA/CDA1 family)
MKEIYMKIPWAVLTVATVTAMLLSACGAKTTGTAESTGGSTPAASGISASPAPGTGATPSASSTASQSATVSPSGQSDDGKVAVTYKMNKNYDIVPIDPAGNKKVVLLTIDDGPKASETLNKLLDAFAKHKAKAIFFCNGYRIKAHPELLKLLYDHGQIIGNHSYDHIVLKKETKSSVDYQIGEVQKQVKELIGTAPVFMRPPNGATNDFVREKAKTENLLLMNWSDGSLDWALPKNLAEADKPQKVIANVLEQLHPGANILMHELPWTAEAMDQLLTKLEEKGYSFVDPRAIDTTHQP